MCPTHIRSDDDRVHRVKAKAAPTWRTKLALTSPSDRECGERKNDE